MTLKCSLHKKQTLCEPIKKCKQTVACKIHKNNKRIHFKVQYHIFVCCKKHVKIIQKERIIKNRKSQSSSNSFLANSIRDRQKIPSKKLNERRKGFYSWLWHFLHPVWHSKFNDNVFFENANFV